MDPATVFCPTLECPARGHTGAGTIRLHSRKDTRFLGTACHQTCTATTGTAFYRLRTSAATVPRVVTLMAHGCPRQAMVVACGFDERTVAAWCARAGRQGQAVPAHLVEHPRDLGQVQADALRVKTPGGLVWRALARLVKTRRWRAGAVSEPRDRPLMRPLLARGRRGAAHGPLLLGTDGLCASVRARREAFRDPGPTGAPGRPRLPPWHPIDMAQVGTRSVQQRVVAVERRISEGTPARVETRRRRSPGNGVINTADLERLNATFRQRWAALTRRGRALARRPLTLQHGM